MPIDQLISSLWPDAAQQGWEDVNLNTVKTVSIDHTKYYLPKGIVSPQLYRKNELGYDRIDVNKPRVVESDLLQDGCTKYRETDWCFFYYSQNDLFYLFGVRRRPSFKSDNRTGGSSRKLCVIQMVHYNNATSFPGKKVEDGAFRLKELELAGSVNALGWWVLGFPPIQTIVQAYDDNGTPTSLHYFGIPNGVYQGFTPGGNDTFDTVHPRINGRCPNITDIVINDRPSNSPNQIKHRLVDNVVIAESTYDQLIRDWNNTGSPIVNDITGGSPFSRVNFLSDEYFK